MHLPDLVWTELWLNNEFERPTSRKECKAFSRKINHLTNNLPNTDILYRNYHWNPKMFFCFTQCESNLHLWQCTQVLQSSYFGNHKKQLNNKHASLNNLYPTHRFSTEQIQTSLSYAFKIWKTSYNMTKNHFINRDPDFSNIPDIESNHSSTW